MQAIITKYLAPSATRGTRMKATCAGGSITIARDFEASIAANHAAAAMALAVKMRWTPERSRMFQAPWVGAGMPDGSSMCWINTRNEDTFSL